MEVLPQHRVQDAVDLDARLSGADVVEGLVSPLRASLRRRRARRRRPGDVVRVVPVQRSVGGRHERGRDDGRLRDRGDVRPPPQDDPGRVAQGVEVNHAHLIAELSRGGAKRARPGRVPPDRRDVLRLRRVQALERDRPRVAKRGDGAAARADLLRHPRRFHEEQPASRADLCVRDDVRAITAAPAAITVAITAAASQRVARVAEHRVLARDVRVRRVRETLPLHRVGLVQLHPAPVVDRVEPKVLRPGDERQERAQRVVDAIDVAAALHEHVSERHERQRRRVARLRRDVPTAYAHEDVDGFIRPQPPGFHDAQHARIVARHRAVLPLFVAEGKVREVVRRRGRRAHALPQRVLAAAQDVHPLRMRAAVRVDAVVRVVVDPLRVLVVAKQKRLSRGHGHERRDDEHLRSRVHHPGVHPRVVPLLPSPCRVAGRRHLALFFHERLEQRRVVFAPVHAEPPRLLPAGV
eukprot:29586-Pelagococcus_subviridis.AAC.1